MIIPKFKIDDNVFIYKKGKLVERVVSKIRIEMESTKSKVGYQFEFIDQFASYLFDDYYLDESEVFSSLEEFISLNKLESC
jgi:hypothetical protein